MKVYLGAPRGFCAGVVRAIDIVELALEKFGAPVYVKHQIVHNPYVVNSLALKGAITVEDVANIPQNSIVVFSAHGSPPEDYQIAQQRDLRVVDATCPLVTKVHNEAKKYSNDGRRILLVGHRGHQEVKGTMGQTDMHLVDDRETGNLPIWPQNTPITVLTQTTLSVDDTKSTIEDVKHHFEDVVVRNDLCYATTNRQESVKKLCEVAGIVLVIGAENSSNCNRLREMAEAHGVSAYLINGPDELNMSWLCGIENVGITSGASTPEELVLSVIDKLAPNEIIRVEGVQEDITFVLPDEFRDDVSNVPAS